MGDYKFLRICIFFHSRCSSVFVNIQSLSRSLSLSFPLAIFFYRVVKETNINIFEADQVFRQCKRQDLVLLEPSVSYDFIGFYLPLDCNDTRTRTQFFLSFYTYQNAGTTLFL